jgi:hypothetical protein
VQAVSPTVAPGKLASMAGVIWKCATHVRDSLSARPAATDEPGGRDPDVPPLIEVVAPPKRVCSCCVRGAPKRQLRPLA